jgi:Na+/H+ antiporter NhaC
VTGSSSTNKAQGETAFDTQTKVRFYGGMAGAILPFLAFVSGVVAVALSGAPDERGFWPILILALCLGLILTKDRKNYCISAIEGMSQPIVMIMIIAWMLASIIGVLMSTTGFVEALIWTAGRLHMGGTGFVIISFLICCVVSVSTGSSFGTILICGPILFPAGGLLGAHTPTLAGAILGGATFGDCIAPISDTTIASALSQKADIGGTVRSRLKYVLPAGAAALVFYVLSAALRGQPVQDSTPELAGDPRGLPMLLIPVVIIFLLLKGRHLLHGLLAGLMVGVALALVLNLLPLSQLFSLDPENFSANSFIIDGINRAVGISFFTILLMGLISTIKASGLLKRLVDFSSQQGRSIKQTEAWISSTVAVAVLLTCHSIVAILTVGEFTRHTGEKIGIHRYRRANLLSLVVCTFPFLLPYFIPVILMANTTSSGSPYNIPPVSPLQTGLHNFTSWALLAMVLIAVIAGFGRYSDARSDVGKTGGGGSK